MCTLYERFDCICRPATTRKRLPVKLKCYLGRVYFKAHSLWHGYSALIFVLWTLDISRPNVTRYYMQHNKDANIALDIIWTHERHTAAHRHERTLVRSFVSSLETLRWRHNGHDSVSNPQPRACLLNSLIRCRSKKTSKLRFTGLCAGNSPETDEFPAQRASNAENVYIWWRHHEKVLRDTQTVLYVAVLICT